MPYPAAVEQWRPLVAKYFPAHLVDKALHVIMYESGGNAGAVGDGGAARGLFQIQDNRNFSDRPNAAWLDNAENNIMYAAQNLGAANGNWAPWGENNLYQGQPFGALGHHPYTGPVNGQTSTGGGVAPSNVITQGDATNWWGGPTTMPGTNWWEDDAAAPSAPTTKTINGVTYQWNGSAWVPSGLPAEMPNASTARPSLTTIGNTVYSWDGYSLTPVASVPAGPAPGPSYVGQGNGNLITMNPDGTFGFTPIPGGQTPVPSYVGNAGGQLISQNPDGTYSFTPVPTTPDTTPNFIGAGSGGIWTQDPVTGEFKFISQPAPRGSRSPTSGSNITYVGGAGSSMGASNPDKAAMDRLNAQIKATAAENAAQRGFTGGQNTIDRNLALYRDNTSQRFQGGESFADRSQQNAQFGANYSLGRAAEERARMQAQLQGAETYGRLVSTPDLAALPAFLQAGGGNVIASMSGGNTALTQNALLPGALALQATRQPFSPLPDYTYQAQQNPNMPAAMPMPALAEGGYTTAPLFMKDDHPLGIPTGREKIVSNPLRLPLQIDPVADPFSQDEPMRLAIPRFAGGTGGKTIMEGTTLTPGRNNVVYTDGSVGWVTIAANGAATDDATGQTVNVGMNTVGPNVYPTVPPSGGQTTPPAPNNPFGTGYTMIDASEIDPRYLPSFGAENYQYAENATGGVSQYDQRTGRVTQLWGAPENKVYYTPQVQGAQPQAMPANTDTSLLSLVGPGALYRRITDAQKAVARTRKPITFSTGGKTYAIDLRGNLTITENPQRQTSTPRTVGSTGAAPLPLPNPTPVSTPATTPTPQTGTTGAPAGNSGAIDTPAGTVNTNTGSVSQNPAPSPAQQQAQQQSQQNTLGQSLADTQAFRESFRWLADTWNPLRADYWEQDPNLRQIPEYAMQTAYGTPVNTLQHQASKLRLPGVSRSSLALAV